MIFLVALLAFYVAWNLGANDVANSMGTSVGSKAITLRQALIVAGILEFTGSVVFGGAVSETLATGVANPNLFVDSPQLLLTGMIAVLIAVGVWMQIATSFGLPVSSSHAAVGAIAGFSWLAAGVKAVDWSSLGFITLGWIVTPLVSSTIAALFYSAIKSWILDHPYPLGQLREWIPWLSAILLGVFGIVVLPSLTQPASAWMVDNWGINISDRNLSIVSGAIATFALTWFSWRQLAISAATTPQPLLLEQQMGRFQVLSACFVAFAHGSNDVGNAIAPLATIVYILNTGAVPLQGLSIPLWILGLGGIGIVGGLAVWGSKVIATIGENIIALQPSSGFCAELATATTVLLASRLGLPVSTSHALVGAVVGIGLVQDWHSVRFSTLKSIGLAWLITLPVSAILGAGGFLLLRQLIS
jgi:PiT family inorganic phosphate transporter